MATERIMLPRTKDLLRYGFNSDFNTSQIELFKKATGMVLGNLDDPTKEMAGLARFANNGLIMLVQFDEPIDFRWGISAFTKEINLLDIDEAVKSRRAIRQVLPQISNRWVEEFVHPVLS